MEQKAPRPDKIAPVSEDELWGEIQQAFADPLLPQKPSLAADFKVVVPPASASAIERLVAACGGALPQSYLSFLHRSDGAAECLSDNEGDILTLWPCEVVIARNANLRQGRDVPGVLAVGDDGRGGLVGFEGSVRESPDSWPVVRIMLDGQGRWAVRRIAPDFQTWQRDTFELRPTGFTCGGG
jgi:hypothetical protein